MQPVNGPLVYQLGVSQCLGGHMDAHQGYPVGHPLSKAY